MQNLTKWFDGEKFVPFHKGIYQRKIVTVVYYSYWNGEWWSSTSHDFNTAKALKDSKSIFQEIPFRGLTCP